MVAENTLWSSYVTSSGKKKNRSREQLVRFMGKIGGVNIVRKIGGVNIVPGFFFSCM